VSRRRAREALLGYALVVLPLVLFATFQFYPLARNFFLGFYRTPPFPGLPRKWVGFDQYRDILTSSDFISSLWTTIAFALMTVPLGIALGVLLAVLANKKLRGIAIYRTIFASTIATSVAVAAVIFGTLFNPNVGLLPWLGIDPQPALLQNPTWALPAVALLTVWQNLGLSFILMSAGLQSIPDDLYEAARVDGARAWSQFRNITVPMLSPTIFFAVVVGTIIAFQTFGQIDLLTQGGPLKRTNVLTYFIYRSLQIEANDGKAAVLAIALFLVTLILTLIQLRFIERRVHYGR
jgi:sn-glycerol 3-phosphate transport system permease protein